MLQLAPIELLDILTSNIGWILVFIYIYYELHWGKVAKTLDDFDEKLTALQLVVFLISRESEDVDEVAVAGVLNYQNGLAADDIVNGIDKNE